MDNIEHKLLQQLSTPSPSAEMIHLRVRMPEGQQAQMSFLSSDTVWVAKQKIFGNSRKELQDSQNYGLYCPPCNGRSGKFLEDERTLKEYPLSGTISNLELKYKHRTNNSNNAMSTNNAKIKKLNSASNQKDFLEFVRKNETEKVNKLLNRGFEPNFNNIGEGETPLTLTATLSRPRPMIIALVSGGALLDFRNKNGQTPIHAAVDAENSEAVRTMLDLGCSPNYRDRNNLTPLFHCALTNKDIKCMNMLLHERAEVECRDAHGWTALHHACKENKVQATEQLLFYGADINVSTEDGNSPLHISAKYNREDCCRILLHRGAEKNVRNNSNMSPLDIASINKHNNIVKLISEFKPADVVLFVDLPSYNDKRRGSLSMATIKNIARSRSIPNINGLFDDDSPSSLDDFKLNGLPSKPPSSSYRASAMDLSWRSGPNRDSVVLEEFQEHVFVLQKMGNSEYGFSLKGTNDSPGLENEFKSNSRTPARNFIGDIEHGKLADNAGMRNGDFLCEINGINVSQEPHSACVDSIIKSGKCLRLKLLRKKPVQLTDDGDPSRLEVLNNRELQATLDNFDKILKSGGSPSPSISSSSVHDARAKSDLCETVSQSSASIPVPPPLPPAGTLGKGSHRSMIALASCQEEIRDNGGTSSLNSSKPGTLRGSAVVFPDAAHDALMDAIKRRRELVETVNRDELSADIESRVNKSKKIHPGPVSRIQVGEVRSSSPSRKPVGLLAPATTEVKTLPKSFKKSPDELREGGLESRTSGVESAGMHSMTLPKKSDLVTSGGDSSGDFLTVAEMLRQNFIKKKLQHGSEQHVGAACDQVDGSVDDSLFVTPSKLKMETTTVLEEQQKTNSGLDVPGKTSNGFAHLTPKTRPAPVPPAAKPQRSNAEDLQRPEQEEAKRTSEVHQVHSGASDGSVGSDDANSTSPMSFGNFAGLVAGKAAQKHKEFEERGAPLVVEPPSSGTTKRYDAPADGGGKTLVKTPSSSVHRGLESEMNNNFTSSKKFNAATASSSLNFDSRKISTSKDKVNGNAVELCPATPSITTGVKIQPLAKTTPSRPVESLSPKPLDGKPPLSKVTYTANKTIYRSTSNNNNNIKELERNPFNDLHAIPPPKEFATSVGLKRNGEFAGGVQLNRPADKKMTINSASPKSPLLPPPPPPHDEPASPDMVFPTLRKTNQQQQSNTIVFKAKLGSLSPQQKKP